jgi:ubiquitin C-terminal hydrolase
VKATSTADSTKSAKATISLTPVTVTLAPSTTSLTISQSQQFTATVTGTANTGVTWSLSPAVGTVSSSGVYTAPASIASAQNVTVKATSTADPTKSATAAVTLNPPVNVTVSPASVTLAQSQTQTFSATVTNTGNTAVTWSLSPVVGSITAAGLYTAPASIANSQTVTVTATSVADSTKSATATVTLNPPVSVTVTPASVTLTQSQTQTFSATVTNTGNTAVTWSLSPVIGSITAAGLYTAPPSIASSQTVTVTATSVADPTKSATATVTLNPPVNVTVSPASVTLTQSQTQTFSATVTNTGNTAVTWSLSPLVGSITAAGLYTAPASIASSQTVTVTATSVADPTKSATATVTLNPPVSVTVTPTSVTLTQSQTQSFSATVTNTGNTAVTWSLSPVVGSITAAGLYTAPASIASSQTVIVTATSVADPTKSATATVTLNPPVTVSLTPSSVSLQPSQTQTVTAAVSGTSNTGVTWSFSPALGSLASGTTTAVYVAPNTAPTTQSVTITATSMADSSKTAAAVIALLQAVTVSLSPSTVTLAPSGTQQFTVAVLGTSNTAVTWSINPSVGTISSAGLYTAPSSILTSQTVTVTAQSVADPTKSASATISLNPPTGTFTYYVDSVNGSDSNPGTLAEPWQTIANVNATVLSPGQSVGFKAGGVWRESLLPGESGTAAAPITFGAYGSGANPIMNGSDLVSGWTLSANSNIYQSSLQWHPNQVYRNDVALLSVTSLRALTADGQWYYDSASSILNVYSATNPSAATIEATRRDLVVSVGQGYITLMDLALIKGNQNSLYLSAANDVLVLDCSFEQSAYAGVNISSGSYNIVLDGGVVDANGDAGGDSNGIEIGSQGAASHDITIENMDIYANGNSQGGANIAIAATSANAYPYNILLQYNSVRNATSYDGMLFIGGVSVVAQYNLFVNNPANGIEIYNEIANTSISLALYNNTFFGNGTAPVGFGAISLSTCDPSAIASLIMKNNIVWSNSANSYGAIEWYQNGAGATLTSDYNDVYGTNGSAAFFLDHGGEMPLAAWQSQTGQDAHSISVDPLFSNATTGDYSLGPGSRAIGAGVFIPGVSKANPPSIGAQ